METGSTREINEKKVFENYFTPNPKEIMIYLMEEENMRGEYFSNCLKDCRDRGGDLITTRYPMSLGELLEFTQSWIDQNNGIDIERIFNERSDEERYSDLTLPFIDLKNCPRNKVHRGTFRDLSGRLRCSHQKKFMVKGSFADYHEYFDKLSELKKKEFFMRKPVNSLGDEAYDEKDGHFKEEFRNELNEYEEEVQRFEKEFSSYPIIEDCNAIISERGVILPLETIFRRLNLRPEVELTYCYPESKKYGPCKNLEDLSSKELKTYNNVGSCLGHLRSHNLIGFKFDETTLAAYVQKWYKQHPKGNVPIYESQKTLNLIK